MKWNTTSQIKANVIFYFSHKSHILAARSGYIIGWTQCKMKMWGDFFQKSRKKILLNVLNYNVFSFLLRTLSSPVMLFLFAFPQAWEYPARWLQTFTGTQNFTPTSYQDNIRCSRYGLASRCPLPNTQIEGQPSRDCLLSPGKHWYVDQGWKSSPLSSLLLMAPWNYQHRVGQPLPHLEMPSGSMPKSDPLYLHLNIPCRDRGQQWFPGGIKKRKAGQGTRGRAAGNWESILGKWRGG